MRKRFFVAFLIAATAGIAIRVACVFGFADVADDSVHRDALTGRWTSVTPQAPGEMQLNPDGTASVTNLTIMEPNPDYRSDEPVPAVVTDFDATATWDPTGYNLTLEFDQVQGPPYLSLVISSSTFGGITLQAISGDSDTPKFTQVFRKAD